MVVEYRVRYFLVIFFTLISCVLCDKNPPGFRAYNSEISLIVSREHRSYLRSIERDFYDDLALPQLFHQLKWRSAFACQTMMQDSGHDPGLIGELLAADRIGRQPFTNWLHPVPRLISGCWNFFKMNDMNPHRDFLVVAQEFPKVSKECYSVGFLQPYLMHYILGCRRLTMIDLDWRILAAHQQMVGFFARRQFKKKANLDKVLSQLEIGWIARFDGKPVQPRAKVNLDTVCFQENHALCKEFLYGFQQDFDKLAAIQLQLSYLHTGKYFAKKNSMLVIYLSNAIDKIYTTPRQFRQFMQQVKHGLLLGQTALFIYHSAGRSRFGVYALKKQSKKTFRLKTVCKDDYLSTPVLNYEFNYDSYFEALSSTPKKKIVNCSQRFIAPRAEW